MKPLGKTLAPEELRQARELAGERSILPTKLTLTPIGKLLQEPEEEVRWLVRDILPVGGLSILCGKPKAGKSTLSRCLALAVARGARWLELETSKGTVFYLALEEKRSEIRRHFRLMGATAEDPVEVFAAPNPQDGFDQLWEAADSRKPALIVIDPLFRFTRVKDANDYATVTVALEPLMVLARETGAHLLTTHHLRKRGDRADGGDDILGSTAIFGAVDTALILRRTDRYRTLSTVQRYGIDLEETVLTLDLATGWVTAAGSRQEADEAQAGDAILQYLASQGEPVTQRDILDNVEGKTKVLVVALHNLTLKEKIVREGKGRKGDPWKFVCRVSHISAEKKKTNVNSGASDSKGGTNAFPENRTFPGSPGNEFEDPDDGGGKEDWWV